MQTAAVGGTEPLCQLLVPLILEGGETVERQQFLPDGFEIVFMLPVAIVIRVALSCQGVRLQGEVRLSSPPLSMMLSLPLRQIPCRAQSRDAYGNP